MNLIKEYRLQKLIYDRIKEVFGMGSTHTTHQRKRLWDLWDKMPQEERCILIEEVQ